MNDEFVQSFPANEVMRAGGVYLHAFGTKVMIKSVRLSEEAQW